MWLAALLGVAATGGAALADRAPPAPSVSTGPAARGSTGNVVPALPAPADVSGEEPRVASNFPAAADLARAGQTGAIPPSAAPDDLGAFRFICTAGPLRYDDPVVYPGRPGVSHLHQFFGNTGANASSTYASLRASGDSTCMNRLNRSAYWIPAMLNGRGQVVRPDFVTIYYKRRPARDPGCQRIDSQCVQLPRGLRFVFGFDMIHPDAPVTGAGYFNCQGKNAQPGSYKSIAETAPHCPAGSQLGAIINAPTCWDGKRLDSPDHRAHVAYAYSSNGTAHCPLSHRYVIPGFTLGAWYTVDATLAATKPGGDVRTGWHLSSDEMPGMASDMAPGQTFHADWFGAWDDAVMERWTAHCINRMLNCSGGDLGDGFQLRESPTFSWAASPRLVPVPPRPAAAVAAMKMTAATETDGAAADHAAADHMAHH
jgi:hypothetical protein